MGTTIVPTRPISHLEHIMTVSLTFRMGLLDALGATDASMIMKMLKIPTSIGDRIKYFNTLRDLPEVRSIYEVAERIGYTAIIMGLDVIKILRRITDPIECWESGIMGNMLTWPQFTNWNCTTAPGTTRAAILNSDMVMSYAINLAENQHEVVDVGCYSTADRTISMSLMDSMGIWHALSNILFVIEYSSPAGE